MSDSPNVLLITADHWSGRFLGCAGHPVVQTPTIDALARGGVRFENAFSACPTCIPARRTLMTGQTARTHGDRVFDERRRMPAVTTLAQAFRDQGYQAMAVGKLHVHPQRDRIGFDDVWLNEEGRHHLDDHGADDWEQHLAEKGYAGQEYASGLGNNEYHTRAWHLPEDCHPTNWAAREMCRTIHRRDPTRPGFWYLSFVGPHQPVWPLRDYLDLYRDVEIDEPVIGDWCPAFEDLPLAAKRYNGASGAVTMNGDAVRAARRAFYATITHIDHQIRTVIGTLREAGLLEKTIIAFTADHGDMLGDHHLWAKKMLYERSVNVPLVISPCPDDARLATGAVDDRLVELRDVMPSLLEMAGLPVPETVEGTSVLADERRDHLYGEHSESLEDATRMIRTDRYKLIWYPAGNRVQLFDMADDRAECHDLAGSPDHAEVRAELEAELVRHLYGDDEAWIADGQLAGETPEPTYVPPNPRGLRGQRGWRFL